MPHELISKRHSDRRHHDADIVAPLVTRALARLADPKLGGQWTVVN
jgi:hypothetical protein